MVASAPALCHQRAGRVPRKLINDERSNANGTGTKDLKEVNRAIKFLQYVSLNLGAIMKRSEINKNIDKVAKFSKKYGYALPNLNLKSKKILKELKARQIGWDITDFGSNQFEKIGLSLFTVRNGNPKEKRTIPYCEKLMFALPGQNTPCHYHKLKTEDIFVRAGSNLIIYIWPSKLKQKKNGIKMKVLFNGSEYREILSGKRISLKPGETVTLTPNESHEFYGDPRGVGTLIGEVSTYNDDSGDNYFIDKVSRFPKIEEDEKIEHYLVGDYNKI